jgi:predicted acyltransferase
MPDVPQAPPRDLALDRFRGGLLVLMVAGNLGAGVDAVPEWLKHAPGVGLKIADLIAPAFVFAIALTYRPSYLRRAEESGAKATAHLVTRALALIGIGAILSVGGAVVAGMPSQWGVLQALGGAMLLAAPFVRFGPVVRGVAGAVLLAAYQVLLNTGVVLPASPTDHGGFAGTLSWGAMLLLATVLADAWRAGRGRYLATCGVLAVLAAASIVLVPVSKLRVTASYVVVALLVAAVTYLLVDLVSRVAAQSPGPLVWWGENPLVLYLSHLLLLGVLLLLPREVTTGAPLWLAIAEAVVLIALLTALAWRLLLRQVRVRL